MPVMLGGAGVELIALRARHRQTFRLAGRAAPALDINDVEQPALRIGEEQGGHAIGETVETPDAG